MTNQLQATIAALLVRGKGILAADETAPTIETRFTEFNLISTPEVRRDYREMLFTTAGLNNFISGVIMIDETVRQRTAAGVPILNALAERSIMAGISVDKGTAPLAACPGEEITEGLDGLRARLNEYCKLGISFTKWRAVIKIGQDLPTRTCIDVNARALALFAALSQEAGLVPIVEPDILMQGNHSIARCEEVASATLQKLFEALADHRVILEQMLIKTGMILPGTECLPPPVATVIAQATLRCFRRAVPAAIPGILFLSGGQSPIDATERLNAICRSSEVPWRLSFSFSRGLQAPVLMTWKGIPNNVPAAQATLYHRARCNSAAIQGDYSCEMERIS
jgi:fructose-bisphosphate aldolase, class I